MCVRSGTPSMTATQTELDALLHRLDGFHDSLLVAVTINCEEEVRVKLGIVALEQAEDHRRARLTLQFDRVRRSVWREDFQDLGRLVIINPAVLHMIDGRVVLGIHVDGNGDLYQTEEAVFREAALAVSAEELVWDLQPFEE